MKPSPDSEELTTPEDEEIVRFTLDLPKGLHRDFKLAAVGQGKSMRELAMEWVRRGIEEINATAKKR
jgi:hypothetical protein